MSHQVNPAAQPPWLKPVNLIAGGVVMAIAGVMNVFTQMGLAARIPDWSAFAFLLPIACWVYAVLSTINWAASPYGTIARRRAFKGVLMSAAIMEAMNVGEHAWVYIEDHSKLDFGFLPIFLVGSVPTLLDVLSVHLIASVLSGHGLPQTESSEAAESSDQDTTEETEPSESDLPNPVLPNPVPSDPILPSAPEPNEDPVLPEPPKEDLVPQPKTENPAPQPEPEEDDDPKTEQDVPKLSTRRQARKALVDDIAATAVEMLNNGMTIDEVKKALTAAELASRYPHRKDTDRNWLNIRKDALDEAVKLVQVA